MPLRNWVVRVLLIFVVKQFVLAVSAQDVPYAITHCEMCGKLVGGVVFNDTDKLAKREHWMCLACSKEKECAVCDLVVVGKERHAMKDGRVYCTRDWKTLVNDQREAERLFFETRKEVERMLHSWGTVPDTNITFTLVDKDEFIRQYRRSPSFHNPDSVMGLTRSRQVGEGSYQHDIFVLNGQRRETFMATAAHEIVHAWLAERSTKQRTLHDDATEGFCETVAWKLMDSLKESFEKEQIESNDYTRGQINALLAAEDEYRFHRVVEWVLGGVDAWLEPDKLARLLVLRDDTTPAQTRVSAPWPQTPVAYVSPPLPEHLALSGLMSGANGSRMALINGATLKVNDTAKIRLASTNLVLRCVEIRERTVVVEVEGSGLQELALPTRAAGR